MARLLKAAELAGWSGRCVDVRSPEEFLGERLPQAESYPLGSLAGLAVGWDRNQPILLVCKGGVRARQAAGQLEALGFKELAVLDGGMDACKRAGVAVLTGRKTIPLFRQVLIGAGLCLLVILAAAAAYPPLVALAWAMGAMLVVAGYTGFCPMAKVLARMPWNVEPVKPACASEA